MAFRADEAARMGYERAVNYLISPLRDSDESQRTLSKEALEDIVYKYGPVIDSYPSWHPLVSNHNIHDTVIYPSGECGYQGLDHTICFANAFITCPYHDGQKVIDSVDRLPPHPVASITAERLDVQLYQPNANPILVKCEWDRPLPMDGMISLSLAIPLILEREIPCWRSSEVAETWETMRPYFLGTPYGSRSSLFVNQETGQAIKKIWNALIYTGMFGNIKV